MRWSRGAERLYGWSAEETVGRAFWTFIAPHEAGSEFETVKARVLAEGTVRRKAHRVTKAGHSIITDVSVTHLPGRPPADCTNRTQPSPTSGSLCRSGSGMASNVTFRPTFIVVEPM